MVATQTSCTKYVHPASSNTAASTTQTPLPETRKRELITLTQKSVQFKSELFSATAQVWSGSEIKWFTLFFCLFYSFLHQQSNLRPHDICQSFQTLLENTYRNMHTNTLYTGWKLCVLNSITFISSVKVPGYQILFHPVLVC